MLALLSRYRSEWLAAALLLGATLAAFGRVLQNDFVNLDDPVYVSKNLVLPSGLCVESILWAATTFTASNWHPLTWLSLQLDYETFGLQPWGFHLTNLLLHAANTVLLFLVLRRATGAVWRSACVAGLFALHPLHVESVAWVAERKDVLSAFFGMLTLLTYVGYARRPKPRRYAVLVLFFALGLLAKPMLVTLPCVLLLLDYWPLRRLGLARALAPVTAFRPASLAWLLGEKIPLFVLTFLSCVMTWRAQSRGGAVSSLEKLPLEARIGNALVGYVTYLGKALWPSGLAAYYPHPGTSLPLWQVATAAVLLAGITAVAILLWRCAPYLLVGWLWYLGMLVPVIGLVQVGRQALADRYSYLPLIGLFLAVVWLVADVVPARWRRPVLVPAAVLVLLLCATATWQQVGIWRDSITLWEHTLALTENNYLAHYNLASALEDKGRTEEALAEFARAARARPDDARMYVKLAQAYQRHPRPWDLPAVAACTVGLMGSPHGGGSCGAASALFPGRTRLSEQLLYFQHAVQLQPGNADYRVYLAEVLNDLGNTEAALGEEREANRLPATKK